MKKLGFVVLATAVALMAKDTDRIQKLEKEIATLKADYDSQFDELYERVDSNEFEASLNHIKWSGSLETTMGNYKGETGNVQMNGATIQKADSFSNNTKFDSKFLLNMDSKISENVKFTGRLAMYKGWADNTPQTYYDSTAGRRDNGANLFVERAYVDIRAAKNLYITIGRQPSSDGPGMSLKENTPRKATYPSLLFNGEADGIVLTYKPKIDAIPNFATRLAYGKGYQWDDGDNGYIADNGDLKDMTVAGFFIEGSVKGLDNSLVVLSAVKGDNFVGMPNDSNTNSNKNLGDFAHYGIYFEHNKVFNDRLNYFISYAVSQPDQDKKAIYKFDSNQDNQKEDWQLLKDDGYAYHIGARVDFDKLKVGYEYNYGSKYWFSYTTGSTNILNKLSTRGKANDVYAIYQFDINQFLRIGYTKIDYEYIGSGYHMSTMGGEPLETDDYTEVSYITYNIRF